MAKKGAAPCKEAAPRRSVEAVDLFCGVGGLSFGLQQAGIKIRCGVDLDPDCEFPYSSNIGASFHLEDIRKLTPQWLRDQFSKDAVRVLAGCAPCQPFSSFRRGQDNNSDDEKWSLLKQFERLAVSVVPDFVTMENVVGLAAQPIYDEFVRALERAGYNVSWQSTYCPKYGVPQHRRRLVLLASLHDRIDLIPAIFEKENYPTVRGAIAHLKKLKSGASDPSDPLHLARRLDPINLQRMKAAKPGGSWEDWPKELRAKCHQRKSGATFKSVYARMEWDQPAPTITTQSYNFGTGRFGHPEQDRSITLREAAILQSFPPSYQFVRKDETVRFTAVGRLIGNAVPPLLGRAIGSSIARAAAKK